MDLPGAVAQEAGLRVGAPCTTEPCGGLSGRRVVRVAGPRGSLVVKGPVGAAEHHVVTRLHGSLAAVGVTTPACRGVVVQPDGPWLLLEDAGRPLPRHRWGADPGTLAVLRGLHRLPAGLADAVPGRYRPGWTDALDSAAAPVLGLPVGLLGRLRVRADGLFEPRGVVSGDANPRNWCDGDPPVLLDLERLTVAAPEIDLATLLPGLCRRDDAERAAAAYGAADAELVLLAKLWTVVELAATSAPGSPARAAVTSVAGELADWVASTWGLAA